MALKHVSHTLRNDREVVLEAVQNDGFALYIAGVAMDVDAPCRARLESWARLTPRQRRWRKWRCRHRQ